MSRFNAHEVFVMFPGLGVLIASARALGTVWPGGVLVFVQTLGLLGAALTEWIGVHAIFGVFLVGVAVGENGVEHL